MKRQPMDNQPIRPIWTGNGGKKDWTETYVLVKTIREIAS